MWTELRHQHIAVVTQSVFYYQFCCSSSIKKQTTFFFFFCRSIAKKIKDFAIQKRVKDADRGERTTMKDLSYVYAISFSL